MKIHRKPWAGIITGSLCGLLATACLANFVDLSKLRGVATCLLPVTLVTVAIILAWNPKPPNRR